MPLSVILVEPEYDENLGYCARACRNFGIERLILVNPKANPQSLTAIARAMHSREILSNAVIEKTLLDALKNIDWAFASSSQKGSKQNLHRTSMTPRQFGTIAETQANSTGLVIGRESNGLTNDEIGLCDCLVTIPANIDYDSLNISHALTILLYEAFVAPKSPNRQTVKADQKNRMVEAFVELLKANNSISNQRGAASAFKSVLAKAQPSPKEANALLTVLQKTAHKLNPPVKKNEKPQK
jgi:TrmH family RNA methyltransferase